MKNVKMTKYLLTVVILLILLCAYTLVANAEIVASGSCGSELTWTVDSSGLLKITGSGTMQSYNTAYDNVSDMLKEDTKALKTTAPWGNHYVIRVEIEGNDITIGRNAFYGCKDLKSVEFGAGVVGFWLEAFEGCSGITELKVDKNNSGYYSSGNCIINREDKTLSLGCKTSIIPSDGSVTKIGYRAFYRCVGLNAISIPDSVTTIREDAFSGCSGLKELVLGNGINNVETNAFEGTVIEKVTVGKSIETNTLDELKIPKDNLLSVKISRGTKSISASAFSNSKELESVTIPVGVVSIGGAAFSGCASLKSIEIPYGVTTIGGGAFNECTDLVSVILPNGIVAVEGYTFSCCSSLENITLPNSITEIGNFAFKKCSSIIKLAIPSSVKRIGLGAFQGCSSLKYCFIEEGVEDIGAYAFASCKELVSIIIPNSVMEMGDHVFAGCNSLSYAKLGDSLTELKRGSFDYCDSLTIVDIGIGIAELPSNCFEDCQDLKTLILGKVIENKRLSDFAVPKTLQKIVIKNGVATIKEEAFMGGYNSINNITIPHGATVRHVQDKSNTLYYSRITVNKIEIGDIIENQTIGSVLGALGISSCAVEEIEIQNGVTKISSSAFSGKTMLTNIIIPNSVTCIGEAAFSGCKGLSTIIIPNNVTSIGDSAFSGCTGLKNITIPSNVTSIGKAAFSGCTGLTTIIIPNGVTSIGDSMFSGCVGLTSVIIPNVVTSIGKYAFYGCTSLTDVTLPNSVTSIGDCAFYRCSKLEKIIIPENVKSIGKWAFLDCENITSVIIPNSVTSIGENPFSGCKALKVVYYTGSKEQWEQLGLSLGYNISIQYETSEEPNEQNPSEENSNNSNLDDKPDYYELIFSKIESYDTSKDKTGLEYVSKAYIDGMEYTMPSHYAPSVFERNYKNRQIIYCLADEKITWMDSIDHFSQREFETEGFFPAIEIEGDDVTFKEGKIQRDTAKLKITIINEIKSYISYSLGKPDSFYYSKDFYNNVINKISESGKKNIQISDITLLLGNTSVFNFSGNKEETIVFQKKQLIKYGSSYSFVVDVDVNKSYEVSQNRTISGGTSVSITINGTINGEQCSYSVTESEKQKLRVFNWDYYCIEKEQKQKEKEQKNNETGSSADLTRAAEELDNLSGAVTLHASSGELEKILSFEQLDEIGNIMLCMVAQNSVPKKQYSGINGLSNKIIDKVFSCNTNLLDVADGNVSFCATTQTKKYGPITICFSCQYSEHILNGSSYAFQGDIDYEIMDCIAKSRLPKDCKTKGYAGMLTGWDMEAFCNAAWKITEGELKSAYNKAYGDNVNQVINIVFGTSVNKIMKALKTLKLIKSGSSAELFWNIVSLPGKKVAIHCPVDVFVYNSSNKLVASVENNTVTLTNDNASITVDGSTKTVWLCDDSYRIVYSPTAKGTMRVGIEEYGTSDRLLCAAKIEEIPLEVGVDYIQELTELPLQESSFVLNSEAAAMMPESGAVNIHNHTPSGVLFDETPASCKSAGYAYTYCIVCEERYFIETAPPAEDAHVFGAWTYLNDTQHYRVCADDSSHVEKEDHKWAVVKETEAATCTSTGVKTYTCTDCSTTKTETIGKTAHKLTKTAAKAATCTAAGNVEYYTCSVCKKTFSDAKGTKEIADVTVKATGHSFGEWKVTKEATVKEEGTETRKCSKCGTEETRQIAKLEITYTLGDVDGDGNISAADARLALRRSVGLETYEEGSPAFLACDVDLDGNVSAADARLILRASVGLEDPKTWVK